MITLGDRGYCLLGFAPKDPDVIVNNLLNVLPGGEAHDSVLITEEAASKVDNKCAIGMESRVVDQ